jgi:hypothetical protein
MLRITDANGQHNNYTFANQKEAQDFIDNVCLYKYDYQKEKLHLMERLIQAIEENTLAHTYAPGGAVAKELAKDFEKKINS